MRDPIQRDQDRAEALTEFQRLIAEGLASGVGDRSLKDLLDIARANRDRSCAAMSPANPDDDSREPR